MKKPCSLWFSLHKFVHLNFFWTLFKNVHCQGPCSLRPCISRPYCSDLLEPTSNKTQIIVRHSLQNSKIKTLWLYATLMRKREKWKTRKIPIYPFTRYINWFVLCYFTTMYIFHFWLRVLTRVLIPILVKIMFLLDMCTLLSMV